MLLFKIGSGPVYLCNAAAQMEWLMDLGNHCISPQNNFTGNQGVQVAGYISKAEYPWIQCML
eukprot:9481364-Prorocentrum_lima.AAC.1